MELKKQEKGLEELSREELMEKVRSLQADLDSTIWRITDVDVCTVMEENWGEEYPDLSEEETKGEVELSMALEDAMRNFHVEDYQALLSIHFEFLSSKTIRQVLAYGRRTGKTIYYS